MATKSYAVGDNEVVKIWSKRLAREALKATVIYPMIKDKQPRCQLPKGKNKPVPRWRLQLCLRFSCKYTKRRIANRYPARGNLLK